MKNKVKILFAVPMFALLAACSSELSSEDGKDLTNNVEVDGEETALEDFTIKIDDGVSLEQIPKEDTTPPAPEFPHLVTEPNPTLSVEENQDSTNYYMSEDNFNNASLTVFTKESYPGVPEVGTLESMGTNQYLEGWLAHVKESKGALPTTGKTEHGFLNWDNGTRGAYYSYEFVIPPPPEDLEMGESVVEQQPTFFTDYVLIRDEQVLIGTSTSQTLGLPEYVQTLEF